MGESTLTQSRGRTRRELVGHTHKLIGSLQKGYLDRIPASVAILARARRADPNDIAADPALYSAVFDGFPTAASNNDIPTPHERAVFTAVYLFANHQRSKGSRMHQRPDNTQAQYKYRIGASVRRLAEESSRGFDPKNSVVRLFNAVLTADNPTESTHHLRRLVNRLRDADIALDYGELAGDLADLYSKSSERHRGVQLRWSRDFARSTKSDNDNDNDNDTNTDQTADRTEKE